MSCARRAGASDAQHARLRPGDGTRGGGHPGGGRVRSGCVHRAGPWYGAAVQGDCVVGADSCVDADVDSLARGRCGRSGARMQPGRAGARASDGADSAHLQKKPCGNRGFCPRRALHVLLRAVLFVECHRQTLGKPRPVRPAVQAPVWLRPVRSDALSPESERQLSGRACAGTRAHGRRVCENRRPDEAARVRGRCDEGLPLGDRRQARHGRKYEGAGVRLFPAGFHAGLLRGKNRTGHVRHAAGAEPGQGALRQGPRNV